MIINAKIQGYPIITTTFVCSIKLNSPHSNHKRQPIPNEDSSKEIIKTNPILFVATVVGIIQTLLHMIYTNRSQYTIQRLLGLTPNGLIKLLCLQVLTFILYGISVGLIVGVLLTRLIALIDSGSSISFD
ncbi:MAG: FtsX-like permease family protein, partial [Solibacillus sp.]